MQTDSIRFILHFKVSPQVIYETLMDSAKHSAFTGQEANISKQVGGAISAYDGYISGKNLELIPYEKIVQAWRADEAEWAETHYSRVEILLIATPEGTELNFNQSGVPTELIENFEQGWIDNYWNPLREIFG
jgi:activator of HSP90 ATPase